MKRLLEWPVLTCFGVALLLAATGCGGGKDKDKDKKSEKKDGDRVGHDRPRFEPPKDPGYKSEREKRSDDKAPAVTSREGEEAKSVMGKRPKTAGRDRDADAGLLTAGSFDDNLYPDFFRAFARNLGDRNQYLGTLPSKFLGHRLVVAARSGDGKPIGNARVTVAPVKGEPSVTLITRTDGTAIFLSSWDQVDADGDFAVTVVPPDGSKEVKRIVPRLAERWQVDLPAAPAPLPRRLDLTLLVDTTGSMGDELTYLKAEFKNIATRVKELFPEVEQRYALVLYRDEGMGDEYVTRTFPFTTSIQELRKHLSAQSAAGGGDYPEAMHRGLEEALTLPWHEDNTARVLFLVADAPPHEQHVERTMKAIDALRKKGVVIYPVAASGTDDACEFIMRSAALLTGGRYLFLTDDSGKGEAHGEPHIPYYQVEKLNPLLVRMIAGELAGKRIEPKPGDVLRTVGRPINTSGKN
jgi:hypothetical protein